MVDRFEGSEVYVRHDPKTGDVILSPRPKSWQEFFDLLETLGIPNDFLSDRDDRPPAHAEDLVMPSLYLLDTNTVSYVIKGNTPRVWARLAKIPVPQVAMSVGTEAELRFGIVRRTESQDLRIAVHEFLLRVTILPWDSQAAIEYAELRAASNVQVRPSAI